MTKKKSSSRKHPPVKKPRSRKHAVISSNNVASRLIIGGAAVFLIGFAAMFTIYLRNDIIDIIRGEEKNMPENGNFSQPPAPAITDIKISDADYVKGSKEAKITVIGFADFQCPYSLKFYNVMNLVMENYPDEVRWVYKHFPIRSHQYSRKAAEAAECSGEQGGFWEFADKLFNNQAKINDDYVISAVNEIGLNVSQFEDCWSIGKYADKVNNDYDQGKGAGVTGSPGIVINGEMINGATTYEEIKEKIEKYLKQ